MNKKLIVYVIGAVIVAFVVGAILGSQISPEKEELTPSSSENKESPSAPPEKEESPQTISRNMSWSLVWEYKSDYKIKDIAISPDGNYIVAVGDNYDSGRNDVLYLLTKDGKVLWKRESKELFNSSVGDWIHDVSVSRNATYIAVGSENAIYLLQRDGSIIWKRENYTYLKGMNLVSISGDGQYIVVGTYPIGEGWIHLFNKDGEELWKFRALGSVTCVSICENEKYVVAGDNKGYVYLFNRQGNLLFDKKMGRYSFHGVYVSISQNGSRIGVGMNIYYESDRIAILDSDGRSLLDQKVKHIVVGISMTSEADLLFVPAEKEGLRIYNMKGELINTFKARERVLDAANTPDGTYLVVGSDDMRIYLLEKS